LKRNIKLDAYIYEYLESTLLKEKPEFELFLNTRKQGNKLLIEINEDIACNIRDWAGLKLQKIGFEKNYDLTKDGKILEDIIDIFYA